jgi:hypothetical protein
MHSLFVINISSNLKVEKKKKHTRDSRVETHLRLESLNPCCLSFPPVVSLPPDSASRRCLTLFMCGGRYS